MFFDIGTTSFATRRYGTSISGVLTRSVWCRVGSASTSIANALASGNANDSVERMDLKEVETRSNSTPSAAFSRH